MSIKCPTCKKEIQNARALEVHIAIAHTKELNELVKESKKEKEREENGRIDRRSSRDYWGF